MSVFNGLIFRQTDESDGLNYPTGLLPSQIRSPDGTRGLDYYGFQLCLFASREFSRWRISVSSLSGNELSGGSDVDRDRRLYLYG